MTTPKQVAYQLTRYAKRHPELHLEIFEIAQVPGLRRLSRSNKSIDESLVTTAWAVPIVLLNPYLAGGLFVDYLVRGHRRPIPRHPTILHPETLSALTGPRPQPENPSSAGTQAVGVVSMTGPLDATPADASLPESKDSHE